MGEQIKRILNTHPGSDLYHYTSANGLIGIMSSDKIWASSAYHLNDAQEFRFALDILRRRLRDRLSFQLQGDATQEILDNLNLVEHDFQVFITSFSEEPDLLSQWYAYGGGNNGYAIGVRFAHFRAALRSGFRLVQCIYSEEEHERLADWIIEALDEARLIGGNAGAEAAKRALLAAAAIKHGGFSREREWRLVKVSPVVFGDAADFNFRQGRGGIVPFLEVPLKMGSRRFAPTSITIGPNGDTRAADFALKCLLAKSDLYGLFKNPVIVRTSATPYRP